MSADDEKHGDPTRAAHSAFQDYLGKRSRGEPVDFDAFCAERPALAVGLRLLHSLHLDVDQATPIHLDGTGAVGPLVRAPQAGGGDSLVAGERIGPYRIVKELGRGGMGAVYLADQEAPVRRKVALKVIKLGMDTGEVVARFEAERQALALMDHPSIARVLDAGATEKGRPYFVMELVAGVPITEYCDERRLDLARRLELFIGVCDGAQHAHQKGIIHRDLKPSNVLVADQDGEPAPKIIDFGVAKAIDQRLTERSLLTEVGQVIGTPEYMSPEQSGNSGLDIDTRTDIYSLGVLLYELLVGLLPFEPLQLRGGGLAELQRVIREEEPARPSTRLLRLRAAAREAAERRGAEPGSLARRIRGDLDWIVMKAMAKDRSQRYAGASELAADVRRHLRNEPVLAGPPGAAYRLSKLLRRNRVRLSVASAVALLLAGMAAATSMVGEARRRQDQLRTSDDHHRQGLAIVREYAALRDEIPLLDERWREARKANELWKPEWDRPDEIAAWQELQRKKQALEDRFSHAVLAMARAVETAPPGSPARTAAQRSLEDLYWDRHRDAQRRRDVPAAEHYKALVQSLGLGTYTREIEGVASITLESEPPGASVCCFRYEEREQRLIPIRFDPARGRDDPAAGIVGLPYLEVEEVRDPAGSPFLAGDRLLRLAQRPVSARGEAARIVESASEPIEAVVMRSGSEVVLSWTPAVMGPESADLAFPDRHGFTLAGYPLDLTGPAIGATASGSPLAVDLPRGSYLFVLRKDGFRDTRVPLAVPGPSHSVRARLLTESEIPPGFVFIGGGSFPCGGDVEAFQSLRAGEPLLEDFFIGRFETTVAEYLRFVNDPEVLERTDDKGEAPPWTELVRGELAKDEKVWLIPRFEGEPRWQRKPGEGWTLKGSWRPDWPMLEVSHHAAQEYAAWRTRRESGPWRYRLPTDLEWEKAARGADGRVHVWGNYMVWSFCWSFDRPGKKRPAVVGFASLDESVYGVRDMAGSVSEHTSGKPDERFAFRVLRGGGWNASDEFYFRIATRNGLNPDRSTTMTGFRLVAESK